jgi:serine/threonine protein kinase
LCRFIANPWDPDELLPVIKQAVEHYDLAARRRKVVRAKARRSAAAIATILLRPGSKLGDYQIVEKIAQGAMGVVYKATHTLLNRTVAIKVLPADCLGDARAVARFRREIKAAGRLNHPNVVRAHDARQVKGIHFLVMEFVEGTDLARMLMQQGRPKICDACEIIRQAAVGLQHAFEHGLVHRDIKPANLMLTPAGVVKVLDLGLARWFNEVPHPSDAGPAGYVVGTAEYMAPEQARGTAAVDTRGDIYSLGCTLFELLTGHPPFSGPQYRTVVQKLAAHVRTPVPDIREERPEVPSLLERLQLRLLAKEPGERFATPKDVAAALAPFTEGADLPGLLASPIIEPGSGFEPTAAPTCELEPVLTPTPESQD